jgi:hypothetical protein
MSPEDYKFFDNCRTMFMTDGWRIFQEEIIVAANSINIAGLNTAEDFWKAKGKLEILAQVSNWEAAVLAAEEQQEQDYE